MWFWFLVCLKRFLCCVAGVARTKFVRCNCSRNRCGEPTNIAPLLEWTLVVPIWSSLSVLCSRECCGGPAYECCSRSCVDSDCVRVKQSRCLMLVLGVPWRDLFCWGICMQMNLLIWARAVSLFICCYDWCDDTVTWPDVGKSQFISVCSRFSQFEL